CTYDILSEFESSTAFSGDATSQLFCDHCNFVTNMLRDMDAHLKTHGKSHSLKCKQCLKQFARKDSLRRHILVHSLEQPYQCDLCNRWFQRKDSLDRHHAQLDTKFVYLKLDLFSIGVMDKLLFSSGSEDNVIAELPYLVDANDLDSAQHYKCSQCFFISDSEEVLQSHISYVHATPRPYQCRICKKLFRQKKCLTEHMRLHTGERPYACKICQRKFHTYSSLHYHRRSLYHF
ncbi:zinc finger protein 468-like, partial [Stegodyphus dumicola]|uniref:zinc finger protein 468-like n=1 Tax=Stegodyphus dumicola TaxID=202533 RepID=UPI0015AAC6CF